MRHSVATSTLRLIALANTAFAAGPICPESDGAQYNSTSGNTFEIECGVGYAGGDIGTVTVKSFEDCILACDANSRCVDVSLSGVACYLKGTLGTKLSAEDIRSARKITPIANPPPACPGSNGKSFTSTSGDNFTIECDIDRAGGDLKMVLVHCKRLQTAAISLRASPQCPSAAATTYTALNNEVFELACDQDFAGGDFRAIDTDVPSGNGGAFGECLEVCSTTDGCYAVTLQGAGCYLKGYPVPASKAAKGLLSGRRLNATAPIPSPAPEMPGTSDVMEPLKIADFKFLGCYEDDQDKPILADATDYDNPDEPFTVTADTCAGFCGDFIYFGLESGGKCFCGNTSAYEAVEAAGQCKYVCKANSSQTCGGQNAIQVYRLADYLDPIPTEEAAAPSPSSPSAPVPTVSSTATTTDVTSPTSASSDSSTSSSITSSASTSTDFASPTSISSDSSFVTNVISVPAATFTTVTDYITSTNRTLTRYGPTPPAPAFSTTGAENTTSSSAIFTALPSLSISSPSVGLSRPPSDGTTIAQSTAAIGLNTTILPTLTSLTPSIGLPVPSANATATAPNSISISANITALPTSTSLVPSAGFPISSNASVISNTTSSKVSAGFPLTPGNAPTGNLNDTSLGWNSSTASVSPVPLPSPISVEIEEPLTVVVTPVPAPSSIEGPSPVDNSETEESEPTAASSEAPVTETVIPLNFTFSPTGSLVPIDEPAPTFTVAPIPAGPTSTPTGSLVPVDGPAPSATDATEEIEAPATGPQEEATATSEPQTTTPAEEPLAEVPAGPISEPSDDSALPVATATVTPIPADSVDVPAPSATDSPVVVDAGGNSTSPSSRRKARGASPRPIRRNWWPFLGI